MAEHALKPIDVTEDTSRYTEALRLGLKEGTPQFYEYMGYKAGKGDWEKTTPAQDIGLVDLFLDSITNGNHLAESRRLGAAQKRLDELYSNLKKIRAVEDLTRQADERTVNRLVPPTFGEAREQFAPGIIEAAGGRVPVKTAETIGAPEGFYEDIRSQFPRTSAFGLQIRPPVEGRTQLTAGNLSVFRRPDDYTEPDESGSPHTNLFIGRGVPDLRVRPPLPETIQPVQRISQAQDVNASIPPLVKRGIIEAVVARAKALPVKPTAEEMTKNDLRSYYLAKGDLAGLERIGGVREKSKEEKEEKNEAKKLGDVLTAAGVEKDSPMWQKLFSALAEKMVTHQPTTEIKIDTQEKASEAAQKELMKSTRTTYDQLKHAPVLLDNIEKAKALIPQAKGFMGTGGETLMEATKFLNNRLGTNISTTGIKNAEELRSRIFFNIMDNLKKMDAQPSQLQQQIMAESLGKLGTDPNALENVLDAYGDAIRGKVDLHNIEVEGAVKRGVKFPYDPTIKLKQKVGPYVEIRVDKQGRKLGRKADGTIEVIK